MHHRVRRYAHADSLALRMQQPSRHFARRLQYESVAAGRRRLDQPELPVVYARVSCRFAQIAAQQAEMVARIDLGVEAKQDLLEERDESRRLEIVTGLLTEIRRGLVLTRETQERARRNGRVRTPEELAAELGLE